MTKMFKQRWFYLGCCLLMAFFTVVGAYAQTKTIKGKVVDEKGQPMIGVSIVVKGTTTGTITDGNGSFSVPASPKDVLSFSFIGYKTDDEKVGNRALINVALNEDTHMLQEAVIVGEFGVKRQARSVGAAAQNVKGSDIANAGRDNFVDALNGRVCRGCCYFIFRNSGSFIYCCVPCSDFYFREKQSPLCRRWYSC